MRQLHDVPAVMQRHGIHAGGSFGLGAPALDPSFPMNPVKCEPVDPSQYRYSPGAISPMYPGNPSPVPRPMQDFPMKQHSPSPMPLIRPPPSSQQRLSPMGTMASPFPVSLVVVGDQNIYNMQAPMRRDPPQGGQAYMGAVAQPQVCAADNAYGTQQQPNPPAQSASSNPMQMEGGAVGGEQQNFSMELSLGNLDSADLSGMGLRLSETNMLFDANLSENLSSHLTLSDAEGMQRGQQSCVLPQQIQSQQPLYDQEMLQHAEGQLGLKERRTDGDGAVGGAVTVQQNMTDSFTNQIKTTIEDICTLNDMYKGTNSDGVDRN